MSKFLLYEQVVIEAYEHYQKGSYRNRCHLQGPNSKLKLSVPLLKGKHEQQPIREVGIAYHHHWVSAMWHTIKTAYGSAPYFPYYSDQLKDILYSKPEFMFDLNMQLLEFLLESIDIDFPQLSVAYSRGSDHADLRETIRPKHPIHDPLFEPRPYTQVFADRQAFMPNLSGLDLLLCLGPGARTHLEACISR